MITSLKISPPTNYQENIKQLPSTSLEMKVLLNICWEDPEKTKLSPVIRAKHYKRNQVINIITDPLIADEVAKYHRDNNLTGPFKIVRRFLVKWLFGDNSILTCQPHESKELRGILKSFMTSIKIDRLVLACQQQFNQLTASWGKDVNLSKELPLLIGRIGLRELMGFSGDISLLCQNTQVITSPKAKNLSLWEKLKSFLSEPLAMRSISKEVRVHLFNELNQQPEAQHPYLRRMWEYCVQTEKSPQQAFEKLAHNLIVVFFAFEETTPSFLAHLLWKISELPNLQIKYSNIAKEAAKHLPDHPQKYYDALEPFDNLIEEGLRLFSPAGFDRVLDKDVIIQFKDKEYKMYAGEKIEYIPYLSGQSENTFNNPQEFNDERFAKEGKSAITQGRLFAKHFGSGMHACPGEKVARAQIRIITALFLEKFQLTSTIETLEFYQKSVLKSYQNIIVQPKANE